VTSFDQVLRGRKYRGVGLWLEADAQAGSVGAEGDPASRGPQGKAGDKPMA
jgi:hypothetical protein